MLFYLLTICLGAEKLTSIKDLVFWSRQQDVPILGLFKEPIDSSKLSLFKQIATHFESVNSGLSFGETKLEKAWGRYDLPEDETSAIVIHGNYYEEDGEWRTRGSTKVVYNSEWSVTNIVMWVTTHSFPPAVDIRHLKKGGADAQRRALFLTSVDMPKITLMHTGLQVPEFFHDVGKAVRGNILVLHMDVSEDEHLKKSIPKKGWILVSGTDPARGVWGEYDGELDKDDVMEWVNEVVIKEHLPDYIEKKNRDKTKKKKKKKKNKSKKKKSKLICKVNLSL